jgi:hypothetical protein
MRGICPATIREAGVHERYATSVDGTQLFSLRENAIVKEPGSS